MTFTSLTGCLEASILIDVRFPVVFRRRKKIERESGLIDGVVVVKQVAPKWMSWCWDSGLAVELFALVGGENQSLARSICQLAPAVRTSRDARLHLLPAPLASTFAFWSHIV